MTAPIIIRETGKDEQSFVATVQFDTHGAPYAITVTNPFSEKQEKELEWYFEQWLKFPFTDKVKAEKAAASVRAYGETLFARVFAAAPDVIREYDRFLDQDFHLEVIGSPDFHALHWEALHDPDQERPMSVDRPVVRRNSQPIIYRAEVQSVPQLRVLLVTARPGGAKDISCRTISRPLVEALDTSKIPARIDMVRPGTFEALCKHLEDIRDEHGKGYYHIIHLDMHGALLPHALYSIQSDPAQPQLEPYDGLKAFLSFNRANGSGSNPVSADKLADLLNEYQVPIIILNACQSGKQVGATETSLGSRLLAAGAQLVLAMGYSVTVSAARLMMTTLYRQLLDGRNPATAIRRARLELYNDKRRKAAYAQEIRLEDWLLPVIYQNRPPGFDHNTFQGQAVTASTAYRPPRTTYAFTGRDIDILQIERLLLRPKRNLLLVQGMGGAGKTTLLHHLGWWWQKTCFVEQVVYFGYDLKVYHPAEIVSSIGEELGLSLSGRPEDDRAAVLHALKSSRHLLILDNLESVTGEPLAVQNTLPPEAQAELRAFLQDLIDGRTLVLLGSRGGEAWLRPDPLRDTDVYALPGLDYEAQTELAEEILENVNAPRYPEQEEHQADFRRLLRLLGGCPLAMEVVLTGLAKDTPGEIITRLQAADVNLDNQQETASKTESILKCVEYSYSNLSEDAQKLLLCLAPFTGVVYINWLDQYTDRLKSHSALVDLPFEQWQSALQEAMNWGLLQPDKQLGKNGYLILHPFFSYFLKIYLHNNLFFIQKQSIETAFMAHYKGAGGALNNFVQSNESEKKQIGQMLISMEYENFIYALTLALKHHNSFIHFYQPISEYLDTIQDAQQALNFGNQILAELEQYPTELLQDQLGKEFVAVIDNIAGLYFSLKLYTDARVGYERALDLLDRSHDFSPQEKSTGKAGMLHQLGIVAQEQRQWEEAADYHKKALNIEIEFDDIYSQASSLYQLGRVGQAQQQWKAAEQYYKEALKIKIEFNDQYSQAPTLHQLGIMAQEQQEWKAAKKYYKEALNIVIKFNDTYSQSDTLHQLGTVAQEQGQWEEAEGYYKKALKIKLEFNDQYSQAKILNQLGIVAQEQGEWEEAEGYYKEALKIKIEYNYRYEQASTLHNLCAVAGERQNWESAAQHSLEATAIWHDYQDWNHLEIAYSALAQIWQSSGDNNILQRLVTLLGISREEAQFLLEKQTTDGTQENTAIPETGDRS